MRWLLIASAFLVSTIFGYATPPQSRPSSPIELILCEDYKGEVVVSVHNLCESVGSIAADFNYSVLAVWGDDDGNYLFGTTLNSSNSALFPAFDGKMYTLRHGYHVLAWQKRNGFSLVSHPSQCHGSILKFGRVSAVFVRYNDHYRFGSYCIDQNVVVFSYENKAVIVKNARSLHYVCMTEGKQVQRPIATTSHPIITAEWETMKFSKEPYALPTAVYGRRVFTKEPAKTVEFVETLEFTTLQPDSYARIGKVSTVLTSETPTSAAADVYQLPAEASATATSGTSKSPLLGFLMVFFVMSLLF